MAVHSCVQAARPAETTSATPTRAVRTSAASARSRSVQAGMRGEDLALPEPEQRGHSRGVRAG
eukprot:scaffold1265_cov366-Prasinococcus_capsulatus_cf.AAC.12